MMYPAWSTVSLLSVLILPACSGRDEAPLVPPSPAVASASADEPEVTGDVAPKPEPRSAATASRVGGDPKTTTGIPQATEAPRVEPAAAAPSTDPLAKLTAAKLDQFVQILEIGARDSSRTAATVAMERGWSVGAWANLYMRVESIVQAGGYDAMLLATRDRLAGVEQRLEEQRAIAAGDGADALRARQSIALLEAEAISARDALSQAEALREGGQLIDARMDDLRRVLNR